MLKVPRASHGDDDVPGVQSTKTARIGMVGTTDVTDYFSRVLRRGQLDRVIFDDSVFVVTPRTHLATGWLTAEHTDALFKAHNERTDGRRKEVKNHADVDPVLDKDENDVPPISVVISLVTLMNESKGHAGLLLLSAKLFRDGRLEAELATASSPWVPSERLVSPYVSDCAVMVGSLDDFWEYSRTEFSPDISQSASFDDALQLAGRLFNKVAGVTVEEFAAQSEIRGTVEHTLCFVQEFDRINAVGGLLEVYESLGRGKVPALVERMCSGWQGERKPEATIHHDDGLYAAALMACGSMSDGFPLTDSQRRAVHAFLAGGDGDVTAVSGPPGTGKTTMLQAIVANLVTRRALDGAEAPVIVGTSTNNQAVTNIISSFASVAKDKPGPLDFRWLPQEKDGGALAGTSLRSLAVYCPAKGKLGEAKKRYLVEQPDKSETYANYSGEEYVRGAKDRFVENARHYFGFTTGIPELQQFIHQELNELDALRLKLIDEMKQNGSSDEYSNLCRRVGKLSHAISSENVGTLENCTSLEGLDKLLDVTLRYAQFWLAVHYFEAQWLLTEDFIERDERFRSTDDFRSRYWRQAAALTPCFVMTAYQVPKYFRRYTRPGERRSFDVGRIDLLIVDEAGQVDTPIGLPSFALASRALVVGDQKQLAPVWSIDEDTDREVAESAGIPSSAWSENLQGRGLTCSSGSSLMRVASHASEWSYGEGEPGLFLAEHFRSHPDIIGFCNTLLYDGLLQPKRAASSSKLDGESSAFLFTEVHGSQDSKEGPSRKNQAEAEAIAAWIVANYGYFFHIYNTQEPNANRKVAEDSLIGVVTPFSAQARLIKKELEKAAMAADASLDLPKDLWEKVTVGTAHRLQGAERPIILFSAVYGSNSPQAAFIDANLELINVAVSRAQDLFIVFAAKNRWGNGAVFSVMAEFARRSDAVFPRREIHSDAIDDVQPADPSVASVDAVTEPSDVTTAAEFASRVESVGTAASLTVVLKHWRDADELREDDANLNVRNFNVRLKGAGILKGETGAWKPSKLARLLGVVLEQQRDPKRGEFTSVKYTPQMQELLLRLYQEGKL